MPGALLRSWYAAFFGWIEPISTILGAYYAHFRPDEYLQLTDASSAPLFAVPRGSAIALSQLGNLYFLFAFLEFFVLRATTDRKVWRTVILGLLIADLGHLYSLMPLGLSIYYDISRWNSIHLGNVLFVYFGAATRICYLLDL